MMILPLLILAGNRSWSVGAIGAGLGMGVLLPVVAIRQHTRLGLKRIAEMGGGEATLTVTGDGITVRSTLGSSEIPWRTVSRVWDYPPFWIVLAGGSYLMTVPLEGIGAPEQAALREAFLKGGVKFG